MVTLGPVLSDLGHSISPVVKWHSKYTPLTKHNNYPPLFLSLSCFITSWPVLYYTHSFYQSAGRPRSVIELMNRSSGLDFSDGRGPNRTMDNHPDLDSNMGGAHLQRNKTERRRLQGLQRTLTTTSVRSVPPSNQSWTYKFNVWMINEGGRQLFFGTWIFLHLLVAVFGFIHYQTKDNLNNARATFGITFGMVPFIIFKIPLSDKICSYCQDCSTRSSRRCYFHSAPSLP